VARGAALALIGLLAMPLVANAAANPTRSVAEVERRARADGIVQTSVAAAANVLGDPDGGDRGGDIAVSVTIPRGGATPTEPTEPDAPDDGVALDNAQLTWGFNLETRGKSYYGACNFLMAGRPGADGDAGAAREWEPGGWGKALYHAESGNAKVVNAQGAAVGFERRCLDPAGQPVRYNAARQSDSTYTDTQIRLTGGTGWRDGQTGRTRIAWQGAFTVVYYDGLTYFWIEDPVLEVGADGAARLTATAGGYGSPREGGAWGRHPASPVTLATAPATGAASGEGALASPDGLTLKHAYSGRAVTVPSGAPPQRLGADSNAPGAWEQSFVDFQGLTGLHSYWYSSGAAIDYRKPPDPVYVSWDAAKPIESPLAAPTAGSSGSAGSATGWTGGLAKSPVAASTRPSNAQGGAGAATSAADPWGLVVDPVVLTKAPKDLVPERNRAAGTSIAVEAAILTLLVSASIALIAWRRGWFRLQPKGIVS
jgi:hypothetical protein